MYLPWRTMISDPIGAARRSVATRGVAALTSLVIFVISVGGAYGEQKGELPVWKGDFDEILERRQLRVLVAYNKLMYFLDGADVRGSTYEWMEQFRQHIDDKHGFKTRKFQIIYLPVTRDRLIPSLLAGHGDAAAAARPVPGQ